VTSFDNALLTMAVFSGVGLFITVLNFKEDKRMGGML
jgi:hypothetical protein